MANFFRRHPSCVSFVLVLIFSNILQLIMAEEDRQVYVVYMGDLVEENRSLSSYHFNMLQQVLDISFVGQSLVRSYTRSFNGFAAYLTVQEQEKLASHEEVVSVFRSTTYYPETTRSWDFMGFAEDAHRNPTVESDTIIGVIDTGIWPESKSFNDEGFGPPPKKWKGACKGGKNFTCNNKLIGARYYNLSLPNVSARDTVGHGTHTASIAAGNYVKDVSFYGLAKGTARGGVPSARIAAYKVCHPTQGCQEVDLLAAFDDAIADGVDIISISIGTPRATSLMNDSISIGALHASLRGILVVQSAGNQGMKRKTSSVVPWVFSVAASSTDWRIITKVVLGNGTVLSGKGVNTFGMNGTMHPLITGESASGKCDTEFAAKCLCLEASLVRGKIVVCNTYNGITEAYAVGAIGSIALADDLSEFSLVLLFLACSLEEHDLQEVRSYFASTTSPKVQILPSESIRILDAPQMAVFSSRGPNLIIPDILKPDITAPGIEILSAFSPEAPPSGSYGDNRSVNYNILSGTSMASPHVAGAAAYVKSLHPDWSPSAIKSALMTTAWKMDAKKDPLAEFSYGAGHMDPVKATDPGLVYETFAEDYVEMLCCLGYETARLRKILGVNRSCPTEVMTKPKDLNYPSMTSMIKTDHGNKVVTFSEKFTRTVTNVGPGNTRYEARTSTSPDYNISVNPSILKFGAPNEKKLFEVVISGKTDGKMVSASLEWFDGVHRVHSPVVLYTDGLSSSLL